MRMAGRMKQSNVSSGIFVRSGAAPVALPVGAWAWRGAEYLSPPAAARCSAKQASGAGDYQTVTASVYKRGDISAHYGAELADH